MKYKLFGLVIALAAMAGNTGCGPALQPFFTSSDLYEDPALEGRWTNGEDTWEFRRVGDGRYRLAECAPECKDEVNGTLFRLGGQLFLDVQESGKFTSGVFPHGVMRLRLTGDSVDVTPLDEDAIKEGLEQKRFSLSFLSIEEKRLLITAPTAKLQQFLLRHAQDPQVWGETMTYRRTVSDGSTESAGF